MVFVFGDEWIYEYAVFYKHCHLYPNPNAHAEPDLYPDTHFDLDFNLHSDPDRHFHRNLYPDLDRYF